MPSKNLKLDIIPATNGNTITATNRNVRNKLIELIKLMAEQEARSILLKGRVL